VAFKSRPRRVILTAFMIAKALGVNIEVLIRKKQLTRKNHGKIYQYNCEMAGNH
jgi:hypothetical protein